jgi:hypothetical protein
MLGDFPISPSLHQVADYCLISLRQRIYGSQRSGAIRCCKLRYAGKLLTRQPDFILPNYLARALNEQRRFH